MTDCARLFPSAVAQDHELGSEAVQKVISKDGTAIAFERSGKGPAIILVDGALCSRSFGPSPKLAPVLSKHFTVFTYDRRGRGDSGDTAPYSKEREVEDIDALIRQAGGSAFVMGLSSGAALGLLAAAGGLNITKLALYEPPFMVSNEGRKPPADHEARLEELVYRDRRGDAVRFFMKDVVGMPAVFAAAMPLMFPIWSKLKAVAHTLPYDAAVMGDYALPTERIASITMPLLVMDGEKSDVRLRHSVRAVADALPNAERQTLKGQTHNVSAAVLAPVLVRFFFG
jgi:pimeloyl-ACP methyl ester carboxylesterase